MAMTPKENPPKRQVAEIIEKTTHFMMGFAVSY